MRFKAKRGQALRMGALLPDGWRFGEARVCWWCGRRVFYGRDYRGDPTQATREHVVPKSIGGSGAKQNVVVACASCNSTRSSQTDWVPYIQLNNVGTSIPRRQWEHLVAIDRLPTRVSWKKSP